MNILRFRLIEGQRFLLAVTLTVLASCAHKEAATIVFGPGSENWQQNCILEGFSVGKDYGVLAAVYTKDEWVKAAIRSFDTTTMTHTETMAEALGMPSNGAALSGDFTGFGVRTIHDDSANREIKINVLYHASTIDGMMNGVQRFDRATAGNEHLCLPSQ